tara:strand:+ start:149 stop:796 length:648 start_codon:yes stop_codon:yes gene_type:complete
MTYKYIVFDTETIGLPPRKTDKFYSSFDQKGYPNINNINASNQCRMVSIAWLIFEDDNIEPITTRYFIIKPNYFTISPESTKIHNITHEYALENGKDINEVLKTLEEDIKDIDCRVAHNFLFDQYITSSEMYRNNHNDLLKKWNSIGSFCTMGQGMANYDFGVNRGGYSKPPRLQELYVKIKGKEFDNAHNALSDTKACAECYQFMIKELSSHTN